MQNRISERESTRGRARIVEAFAEEFQKVLIGCPIVNASFYNTFDYTRTGNNYSHPRTIGLLVKTCYSLQEIAVVDVDVHLNAGRDTKFQPDVVALDDKGHFLLILDFESPNSSDARIPGKDVESYLKWIRTKSYSVPYLIITSLPKQVSPTPPRLGTRHGISRPSKRKKWELRYTSPSGCNREHAQYRNEIETEPFDYWYRIYRKKLEDLCREFPDIGDIPIYFGNLNGLQFSFIDVIPCQSMQVPRYK